MTSLFIVEDDISIQNLYIKYLKLFGFEVIDSANNGEEAIKKFKLFKNKPDLILMDHRMPVKDGIETTKELLKMDNNIKIIFASADKTIKKQALSLGIIGFLEKPFSLKELVEYIKNLSNKN